MYIVFSLRGLELLPLLDWLVLADFGFGFYCNLGSTIGLI